MNHLAPSLPFVDVRPPLGKWCQLQSSWTSQTSLCYLGWQWAKWGLMVDGCTRNMFYMFFQRSMIDGRFRWTSRLFSRQGRSIGWCRKLSMTGINTSGFWDVYIFLDVPYLLLEYFFRCPSSSRLPAQQHHSWGAVISRHAVKLKNGQAWCPRLWLHCEQMSLLDLEGQRHDLMAPLPVDLWKVLEKLEAGEKLKTNMQCAYLQKTPFCFFFGGGWFRLDLWGYVIYMFIFFWRDPGVQHFRPRSWFFTQ